MNSRTISCLLVVIFGGLLFGYTIGYVAPLEAFYGYVSNCTAVSDEALCTWVGTAGAQGCAWLPSDGGGASQTTTTVATTATPHHHAPHSAVRYECRFREGFGNCSSARTRDSCVAADAACQWDHATSACRHVSGWTANENGVIATMMMVGALVSSTAASAVVGRFGLKTSLALASLCNLVGSVVQTAAWATGGFAPRLAALLAGRFIIGLAGGTAAVVCPMYVGEVAHREVASIIGVCFQIFVTAGIMLASIVGFAARPPKHGSTMADAGRFQALNGVGILLAACQLFVSWWAVSPDSVSDAPIVAVIDDFGNSSIARLQGADADSESASLILPPGASYLRRAYSEQSPSPSRSNSNNNNTNNIFGTSTVLDPSGAAVPAAACDSAPTPFLLRPKYVAIALCLGCAVQLSGINAVMNYVPSMARSMAQIDDPFIANMLVMVFNALSTAAAVVLARGLPVRRSFIGGAVLAGAACLIAGVPTYPGVTDDGALRNGLVICGVLLFIAIFASAVAPSFYVLAQSVFPADIRATGCATSVAVNFLCNALVNFGFPVAVEGLSGGPSGDQRRGLAIVYLLFGATSISLAALLVFLLRDDGPEADTSRRTSTLTPLPSSVDGVARIPDRAQSSTLYRTDSNMRADA